MEQENLNTNETANGTKPVLAAVSDLEIIKDMLLRHKILSGIAYEHLDEFQERMTKRLKKGQKEPAFETVRNRFRKACNEAHRLGLCTKEYVGTTAYQTSDTLGGKVCINYTEINFHRNSTNGLCI
jgi:hypothetical protein